MQFGKFTGADLRLFLRLIGIFQSAEGEFLEDVRSKPGEVIGPEAISIYWCNMYEKPFIEHVGGIVSALGFTDVVKEIAQSSQPVKAMAELVDSLDDELELGAKELGEEDVHLLKKGLPALMGLVYSLAMSLKSLLVYGCYLNDLIARVRENRDQGALFSALKIDPTCLGCPSVVAEIGRAKLAGDKKFFKRLKNAIDGKLTKREQANFQKMRVIFQVLKETGAERLTDAQLHELFVNQLGLYTTDKVRGDVRKNLRKLANQYLTKGATT